MNSSTKDIILGSLIVLIGLVILLINVDVIDVRISGTWITTLIFFAGFIVFMAIYFYQNRKEFWPLIPAFILLGLSILIISNEIGISSSVGAGVFILFIGLSFLIVYLFHRENWWAIIPGGMIASVSLVIFFSDVVGVGLMFLGMGGTFFALYPILKKMETNSWWTFIPGSILALMGILFLLFESVYVGQYALPTLLIIGGIILIVKSIKKSK
jgi:hypothetical protein